jgi:colicin import membrane protein
MAATSPPNPKLSLNARAVLRPRAEPGRLPAAFFAIIVHAGFFAVLIFGVAWQVKPSAPLSAEVWSSLPPAVTSPVNAPNPAPIKELQPPPPPPPEVKKVEPPPAPPQPTRAEIELKAKKEREEKQKREVEEKKRADEKKKAEEEKVRKAEEAKQRTAEAKARDEAEARETALQAARAAAVRGYADKIAQLIRSRANIPDSVMGKPTIEVNVRFLAGSNAVSFVRVLRPSGNAAYDQAVERAINGIQNWPQPDDPSILGGRRELNLRIEHER